jgi:hypothetical protein
MKKEIPMSDPQTCGPTFTDYERGRREAFEEAAGMLEMSDATIRVHCGEISAQEMRTLRAVLRWKAAEMREAIDD